MNRKRNRPKMKRRALVAILAECLLNRLFHAFVNRSGSAQVSSTLLGDGGSQVASSGTSVHSFTRGRQAKSLFRGLVGLHFGLGFGFGHDKTRSQSTRRAIGWKNMILPRLFRKTTTTPPVADEHSPPANHKLYRQAAAGERPSTVRNQKTLSR